MSCLLELINLKKYFPVRQGIMSRVTGHIKAVDDISFSIASGECFGLVGESGCGKTTVGRCIAGLLTPSSGQILFEAMDLTAIDQRAFQNIRRDIQIIFQDPYSSLNPRMTVEAIIKEGMIIHRAGNRLNRRKRVYELLDYVGLQKNIADRYPHEFSGGQRQRIGIARALALNPKLIICDEPVSALDVSIQAQVLNLLHELQDQFGLTYLFISHDLSVIRHFATHVAVMYLGKIFESAPVQKLFSQPAHPYTQSLLASVPAERPSSRRKRSLLEGEVPSPLNPPKGCRFHTRCPRGKYQEICKHTEPVYRSIGERHFCACHFSGN